METGGPCGGYKPQSDMKSMKILLDNFGRCCGELMQWQNNVDII